MFKIIIAIGMMSFVLQANANTLDFNSGIFDNTVNLTADLINVDGSKFTNEANAIIDTKSFLGAGSYIYNYGTIGTSPTTVIHIDGSYFFNYGTLEGTIVFDGTNFENHGTIIGTLELNGSYAVPEPAEWATLLLGLPLVAGLVNRRKTTPSQFAEVVSI